MDVSPKFSDILELQRPTVLSSRRFLVLNLINKARSRFGVSPVVLDTDLNDFAQNYSQAMIKGNFFGHYDLQGRGPSQRARLAGIM